MTAERPGSNQQVVPRPRSSAGRAGRSDFQARRPTDDRRPVRTTRPPPEGVRAGRLRDRDVPALAGRGRLRARRRRLAGRSGAAAVHDHPAAPEHHRGAPPGARPDLHARGRDDPPGPHAPPPDALAAGAGPRLDRGPVRPRSDPGRRKGRAGRASAGNGISSGCGGSWTRPARSCSASSAGSAPRSTGAGSGSPWTTVRPGPFASRSPGSTARTWPTGPRP